MPTETVRQTMSVYGMFQDSDIFMKALMIGLLLASIWSWAIIFEKAASFKKIRKSMQAFTEKFWSGIPLSTLYNQVSKNVTDPLRAVFVTAMREWQRMNQKNKTVTADEVQEVLEKNMQITVEKQLSVMENHMLFLASTGSVAPLLGLFGTVWGIMDSFNAIGLSQNTNITAVAPGVAEALLTTALGLIAAIPALIAHNKFSHDINHFTRDIQTFSDEFEGIVLRQMEN